MVSDDQNDLLFIEPTGQKSKEPVIDDLAAHLREEIAAAESDGRYAQHRGSHNHRQCSLRSSRTFTLRNGLRTHQLAVHYLIWHRDEIPESELEKARTLL